MNVEYLKQILTGLGIKPGHVRDDGWMAICCPFAPYGGHKNKKDSRPSFHVRASIKKVTGFNCYGCGRSGNMGDLVTMLGAFQKKPYIQLHNLVIQGEADIVHGIAFDEPKYIVRPEPIWEGQIKGMYAPAWTIPEARKYLIKRMISEPTATLLGLVWSGDDNEDELDNHRIMFPVRNRRGKLFGYSGRCTRDSRAKVKDMLGLKKSFFLLGEERLEPNKPVILVEGLFAFASLYEVGADRYGSIVASLGAHLHPFQAETLLDNGGPVYCFYDNDPTGHKGIYGGVNESGRKMPGVIDMLTGHPALVPPWPVNQETQEPLTDPDQLLGETVKMMMDASKLLVPPPRPA